MAHATPQVQESMLIRPDHRDDPIMVDTITWFAWLEQATTFAFVDAAGRYTARKERAGRAGWYWKAYRMEGGKLRRAYLGKSAELTLERLCSAAASLRGTSTDTGSTNQASASDTTAAGAALLALPMSTRSELLATKLALPSTRSSLVARPRLVECLNRAIQAKLTLLLAPAGYGKTTLLAQWLHRNEEHRTMKDEGLNDSVHPSSFILHPFRVAWLSLDADDNDPVRFWSYVAAALDRVLNSTDVPIVAAALAALQTPEPPPITSVLTDLVNGLSAQAAEIILVLDDYHAITEPSIHRALAFLIERQPQQLHLLLATRNNPPLPLGRLRVHGELVEMRAEDLRFRAEEAAHFLTEVHGLPLAPSDVDTLQERAEGWIAGLQMAALAMRRHNDGTSFTSRFKGNHHFVAEYLTSEVLERLPPYLQRFVAQSSIVDRMSASLCDALLGREAGDLSLEDNGDVRLKTQDSGLNLAELERANVFIAPLDGEQNWYRYHQLFREVAHDRLRTSASSTELAELHVRASVWYEQHEMVAEAVQHAIGASDWERATVLIERNGLALIQSGSASLVRGWLEVLPDSLLRARPTLRLYHAMELMYKGQFEAAEAALRDTERYVHTETPDDQALTILAQVTLVRAGIARAKGDLAQCIAQSQRVMPIAPQLTMDIQAEATLNLARAYQLNGDAGPAAEQLAEQAIALMRASGSVPGLLAGVANLARLHAVQGRLDLAFTSHAQAPQLTPWHGEMCDDLGYYAGLADLLRERNELGRAAALLDRGLPFIQAERVLDVDAIAHYYLALARLQHACGDRDGALAALDTLAHLARQRRFKPLVAERCAALRARLHLMQGQLPVAVRWAETSDLHAGDTVAFPREELYLTLARVRVAQSRGEAPSRTLQAVLNLLDRLLVATEAGDRVGSVIEILIIRALALNVLDNHTGALVALTRALVLAAPEGYVRSFVDEGAPMLELLREAYARGIVPDYVERLLAVFPQVFNDEARTMQQEKPAHRSSFIVQPLLEPLTARELEVLRLIAEGASNAEIAHRLTLSLGTIKRYANNIFSKLNVQSRTQATAQARKLRIV